MAPEKEEQTLVVREERSLRHGHRGGALRREVGIGDQARQVAIARGVFNENRHLA